MNTRGRPYSITLHRDQLPIFLENIDDRGRSLKRLIGSVGDAGQEKAQPRYRIGFGSVVTGNDGIDGLNRMPSDAHRKPA